MKLYLRVLGPAVLAVLVLSGTAACTALATNFKFRSEGTSTTLTGADHVGTQEWKTDAGTVSCSTVNYSGALSGSATESFEVTPTFSGCTAFGFINVPFHVNGCKYRFGVSTTKFRGALHIACGPKPMEITAFGCRVTIGSQTPQGELTYTNVGAGTTREVTVDFSIFGVHYSEDDAGGGCVQTGVTKSNGTNEGEAIYTGETHKKVHLGFWVE